LRCNRVVIRWTSMIWIFALHLINGINIRMLGFVIQVRIYIYIF
jgi:hypothetical protein